MAHALATDPIGQLEENLQCNVCLEVLKDPRTLPCCHSFCKDCLEGVVQTCRNTAPHGQPIREIRCPNCRATFPLDPDKHVADMPRNHFICNLVKVTAVLDRGIGVPCSHNCNQSYSVARCVTCEKFLCRECLADHNKYRGHDDHSVLTMEELSKPENRKKIKDKMYCNEHSGKKLKVYCETCNELICKDCMDFKHIKQGHSCFLVKDVANDCKELLASSNKAMEDALTQGNAFVQRLSLTTKQLDRDAEDARVKIARRKEFIAKKFLEMLDKKAESLSKKVYEIHKNKRANLDRQTEETTQFVENVKTSVQLSKKLVDEGTEEEIISSQKMMLDNANNLLAKREGYFRASIPVAKFRYTSKDNDTPINDRILRGLTNTLGEVDEESEDMSHKTLKIAEADLKCKKHLKPLTASIEESDDTSRADQSGRNIEPEESFNINSLFLRYIMSYHYEEYQKLENVSQEISFEVPESITDRHLKIFAHQNVDEETFSKTVDNFIVFYQNQNQKMLQEVIPEENKDIIFKARTKFSLIVDSTQGKNKMVIFGERDKVQEALKFLKSKGADSTATAASSSSSAPKAATSERFSKGATGGSSPNPKGGIGEKVLFQSLSCALFQDVKVAVYQGDVTKDTADVIVNPANERLQHSAGAAEAIVKAGGKIIQDESDEIMKKLNRSLSPGEVVVTNAGNLPCNFIIHAVGPRWAAYQYYEKDKAKKVLFNVVLNCLTNASHYAAKKISIPAISSDIFGFPVKICAEVLFSAAADFAKNAPKSNSLKEIRFVNIGKATTQVFVQEIKKRFGASVKQGNVEVYHSKYHGAKKLVDQQLQFIGGRKGNPWENATDVDVKKPLVSYTTVNDNTGQNVQNCFICLGDITERKTLDKCGHSFCARCINEAFKHSKKCPVCSTVYGPRIGNQPPGQMFDSFQSTSLPGCGSSGTIVIFYRFPSGIQGPNHPNPGKSYTGTERRAYLPDNKEGRKVLELLKKVFNQKLTFTIGRSTTTGMDNCVIWNDIHHKTSTTGGPTCNGYPDPTYLSRVQEELAEKGITD